MTNLDREPALQRVFITGEPGCGKTTVLRKTGELLLQRGLVVGGMVSQEIRQGGIRIGFSVEDVSGAAKGVLAGLGGGHGPHVGKYTVNIHDLEQIGAKAIREAINNADVILVDELGPMELHSRIFVESVEAALDSRKHLLATIHKRATHPLVVKIKSNPRCSILEVTLENRDELANVIVQRISATR